MEGNTISPKWRHILGLIPGYDPFADAKDCWFDEERANECVDFFTECITHVKGELAGKPFVLEPWEQSIVGNLFGWKRLNDNGQEVRRYKEAFIYVPRKNGKTTFVAGIILLVMFTDHEPGAEIYSSAGEKEQATLTFSQCEGMIHNEPEFEGRVRIYTALKSIVYDTEGTSYKAISADAKTKHGFNSHLVINDELHVQPNRKLVDVLETSTGARLQPLIISVTTADYARPSICNEKLDYAGKVRDGIINDPAFLPVIYEATIEDDWKDPKIWAKVNPNLGVSISLEYLKAKCKKAIESPTFENTFKRLHLNIQTEQDVRWIQMDTWDACGHEANPADLEGQICYAGLDLSTTTDITAFVLYFPENGETLPFFWVPKDNAGKREEKDRVPYLTWAREGYIEMTAGNVVDYDAVRLKINELGKVYNIKEIAVDRWNSTQITTQLGGDGFTMVPFGQGFASMSAPSKELEKLILQKKLCHGNHPVLRWMASNVSAEIDAAGNIKPSKSKSVERIDGIVALIMAIGRAIAAPMCDLDAIYREVGI